MFLVKYIVSAFFCIWHRSEANYEFCGIYRLIDLKKISLPIPYHLNIPNIVRKTRSRWLSERDKYSRPNDTRWLTWNYKIFTTIRKASAFVFRFKPLRKSFFNNNHNRLNRRVLWLWNQLTTITGGQQTLKKNYRQAIGVLPVNFT